MGKLSLRLFLVLHLAALVSGAGKFSRADFPLDFVFSLGTSAYQVEGAASEDGRTPSIWDTFVHAGSAHGATGDIACDGYHKYKEDVQLMVETGLEAYRFSISWSRLIPNGRGPLNPKGLKYYNNFIDELVEHGKISQHMLMCALENLVIGFCTGLPLMRLIYLSWVGMMLVVHPQSDALLLLEQTALEVTLRLSRTLQPIISCWHMHQLQGYTRTSTRIVNPLVFGDYPETVKKNAGTRVPDITKLESKQVMGSFDFLGVNHYKTLYVKDNPSSLNMDNRDVFADMAAELICQRTQCNSTLQDMPRVRYLHVFVGSLLDAVRNGSNARGYFT